MMTPSPWTRWRGLARFLCRGTVGLRAYAPKNSVSPRAESAATVTFAAPATRTAGASTVPRTPNAPSTRRVRRSPTSVNLLHDTTLTATNPTATIPAITAIDT